MAIKYTKWTQYIPNGHGLFLHFLFQCLPKFTQIRIFGLKIYHLETLIELSGKAVIFRWNLLKHNWHLFFAEKWQKNIVYNIGPSHGLKGTEALCRLAVSMHYINICRIVFTCSGGVILSYRLKNLTLL
jgi:hypothetical protein